MEPGASAESLGRAEKLRGMLVSRGLLKGTVLTWQGTEYDVSRSYVLCDGYQGICYKGYEAGFSEPVILAVYEIAPGEPAVQPVDYIKFKRDRSQDAAQFYMERKGLSEADVYKLQDELGQYMFDAMGQLTKSGELAYETDLEGKPPAQVQAEPPPAQKGKPEAKKPGKPDKKGKRKEKRIGRSDTGLSKYSIEQLGQMGYREISKSELDCIHSIPIDDSELFLEKVQGKDGLRYFLNPKDPALLVAMTYRKQKVCNPHGTATFGKE